MSDAAAPRDGRWLRAAVTATVAALVLLTAGRATLAAFMNWADATTNTSTPEPHGIDRAIAGLEPLRDHLPAHGFIAYQTNRDASTVAAGERLLHVRNAAAPLVLSPNDERHDIVLLDLEGDAEAQAYCEQHSLRLIASGADGLSIATRSASP